jgi:CheY-like chemotaxis protein
MKQKIDRSRQTEAKLNAAIKAAEAANAAKSQFLSNMSHELRTPLNAILGFAQLMKTETPPPTQNQQVSINQILQAGWYLLDLINEILDLSLIESGKLTLSLEPVSIAEVLSDCRKMLEPLAEKRGIAMIFPQFDVPLSVFADRTRVQQVIINLLSNAIKYNRPNGTISIAIAPHGDARVRLSVADTGIGLKPERLKQLFQPFNRLGQENGEEQGTGIGLVVTKRLIEAMRGKIGVESEFGVGSVFWIELIASGPAKLGAPASGDRTPRVRPEGEGSSLRTLLYVEDNPANMQLVEMLIARRSDLRLLTSANGDLALELAQAHLPDLILMDINLQGASGTAILAKLRKNPATKHIPAIALSANAAPRDIERGLKAGFFRYLTKPVRVDELMEALDSCLTHVETAEHPTAPQAA